MADSGSTIELAALGRPFSLGMMYDCRRDLLVPGLTLWDKEDLEKNATITPKPSTEFKIVASESIEDKTSALNVDASLKASFLGGLIKVDGSAKYLSDSKTSQNQARVTLNYKATTKFHQLSMNHLGRGNVKHPDVFDSGRATHVVTGILYGAQAFFVFDHKVSDKKTHQDIEGDMKAAINKIPTVSIDGQGSVKMDDKDIAKVEELMCHFHGDFSLPKNPVTFKDAIQVYQSLPELLGANGENAVPLNVWLMPLKDLDSSAAQLVRQISIGLVMEAQRVLEDFSELELRCSDELKSPVAQQFPQIRETLRTFKDQCNHYKMEFQKNLANKLPLIRGGGEEESVLAEFLETRHSSPFNSKDLTEWMDGKEREINFISSLTTMMKNAKIVSSKELETIVLNPETQRAVCFVFTSLPTSDPYLSALSSYLRETPKLVSTQDTTMPIHLGEEQWYTAEVREKAKLFNDFSEANKDNKNIQFLITATKNESQRGASIYLYENVSLANTNLQPPSKPGPLEASDTTHNSVTLKMYPPQCGAEHVSHYSIEYCVTGQDDWHQHTAPTADEVTVSDLSPNTEYKFRYRAVCPVGRGPDSEVRDIKTLPTNPPGKPQVSPYPHGLSVTWEKPTEIGDGVTVESYSVEYAKLSTEQLQWNKETSTTENVNISGLEPMTDYAVRVRCECGAAGRSKQSSKVTVQTTRDLKLFLRNLGLEHHYTDKLSLNTVLQIDKKTITDEPATCHSDLAWHFLKKLIMVNVTARNVKCSPVSEPNTDDSFGTDFDLDSLLNNQDSDGIHPLDIVTALFLCSDGLLQQEMALKMSMCQFSVPLLLPNCETGQCQFMLWAMRDIIKRFRPHSLSDPKGFIEDRIVLTKLPLVSFVRLGECSLSKSKILNTLLSNPQQYHDTFVHRDMKGGDCPRAISDGLVEMSWYLPCGNINIDVFGEPVAIANLRGDIKSFEKQYEFLCQTSAAVFVFFDNLDSQYKLLSSQNKTQLFLVCDTQSKGFNPVALKKVSEEFNLNNKNFILKTKRMNDADFVTRLTEKVRNVVNSSTPKMKMESMTTVANTLGISVDEDSPECQDAKRNADAITSEITDILEYKKDQLPLQGHILKKIARLEKEEFRLQNAGDKNIEIYKGELQQKKRTLREQQNQHGMSDAMACFINALSSPGIERAYFFTWMRMNLDDLSRVKLACLREQYKEKCQSSENKDEIKKLDQQISNSSLGIEHFLREMGQIYESSPSLPENSESHKQLQHLPKLCAKMLLEGFPMELVDGDASIIPLRWVKDVLTQLNDLVGQKNKLLVVTVLGVQSTGKSTLLNTMFGVQFAVSSGRCTRGAFMLLVRVEENFRRVLNCDFVLIIDTEGLKSPELAQLDNSYEHDNELATLVVGLSDVTIINIAMENIADMKDILQIVVHAFLRMKEVGKSPNCQFVHQNVSDVSAQDKNQRDRNLLLQQLNEMTQAAARMENKEEYKNFTDVMKYNPDTGNWYIPGLWHGSPPMAPVNRGYSEAVYEFKKNIVQILGSSKANKVLDFPEWTESLWTAVQHENFIFSFQNSLVADAYMKLCKEFSELEWDFKKHMCAWVTQAETRISNFGTVKSNISTLEELLDHLKTEASKELSTWETKLLQHLTEYFKQKEGHIHLVERYREEFLNTAKSLITETEYSVCNQLVAVVEIRRGMISLEVMKTTFAKKLEDKVLKLIEECRKSDSKREMISSSLDQQFDELWKQTVCELDLKRLQDIDVYRKVEQKLRKDLKPKGGHACKLLAQRTLQQCGNEGFKVKPEGRLASAIHKASKLIGYEDHIMAAQNLADRIIKACRQYVSEKVEMKTNYHDTYIIEILHNINNMLSDNREVKTDIEFEVNLKQHICGIAAREFQKMHDDFKLNNDPQVCLNKQKDNYFSAFKDLFDERDQCQKKAEQFTNNCLKPAVEESVTKSLGPDIVDAMLAGKNADQFSTRSFFQHSLLKYLLSKDRFETYASYTSSYQEFVEGWIFDQIVEQFSRGHEMLELEKQHIEANIKYISSAITNAQKENITVEKFIQNICDLISDKLVIPQDALQSVLILNKSNLGDFVQRLTVSVKEMGPALRETFKDRDLQRKLKQLRVKPQNVLFNRVFGCGQQCPFCKVPCEAGGKGHTEHFASVHRPRGLGRRTWIESKELVTDLCSSSVASECLFRCSETEGEWHPYKEYRKIFPSWKIQPDPSIEASDYWKYVMAKFNKEFAKEYNAKPADIPPSWKDINKHQAQKSLDESFHIK